MMRKASVRFLLHDKLNVYDKECVCEASGKLKDLYGNLFAIAGGCSTTILDPKYLVQQESLPSFKKCISGELLLEHIIETSNNDITFFMTDIPVVYAGRQILPIAMFCYDPDEKRASAIVSLDVLHSRNRGEYVKNILANIEHEIGEMILGEHCENVACPLYFHSSVSDMKSYSEEYCKKCYQRIVERIGKRFFRE